DNSKAQDDCDFGKFVLVSRQHHYPNCAELLRLYTPWPVNSHEPCFKKACELRGNVVHFRRTRHCFIYRCRSNGNDWDYRWRGRGEWGVSYALPHQNTPRCHNSYFMRRTWDTSRNVSPGCNYINSGLTFSHVHDCMREA
ncbi:unnamed protein product, partial [Owenia fusiformis]